jgi:hypothetical protein
MAISDILSDAVTQVRDCLRARPEAYEDMKGRLDMLLLHMDAVRTELDTPPNRTPRD